MSTNNKFDEDYMSESSAEMLALVTIFSLAMIGLGLTIYFSL